MSEIAKILSKAGLSIEARENIFFTTVYDPLKFDLMEFLIGFEMEKLARGGDWSATITLLMRMDDIEDWYVNGLGRTILVYNQGGVERWSGFVNRVRVNVGALSEDSGAMLDIGNRVICTYTPINYDVYPPVQGATTETIAAQDLNSQARYGIIEKIITAGVCTDSEAAAVRDLYLLENAWARSSGGISLTGGEQYGTVTLECLGFIHMYGAFIFNTNTAGTVSISTRLSAIVAFDPNRAIKQFDTTRISTNAYLVPAVDNSNRFALDIVAALANLGNAVDTPYIWGGDPDRVFYYRAAPTQVKYEYFLTEEHQQIRSLASREILHPWDVDAGEWMIIPDFLSGGPPLVTAPKRSDARYKFLESVIFRAPYTLDVSGSRLEKLPAMLSKIAMSGGY